MNYGDLIRTVYERWHAVVDAPAYPHALAVTSSRCTEENDRYVAEIVLSTRPTATDARVIMGASIPFESRGEKSLCCVRVAVARSVVRRVVQGVQPPIDVHPDHHRQHFVESMVGHTAALVLGVPYEKPAFGMDGTQLFLRWHGEQLAALSLYFTPVPYNNSMYQATGLWAPGNTGGPGALLTHTEAVSLLTMEDFL